MDANPNPAALPTPDPNALLTVLQVAARLQVSRATVYRLARRRELSVVRVSAGKTRVRVRELERYLDRKTIKPRRAWDGREA
jgi:excisionase family DNA binding protein